MIATHATELLSKPTLNRLINTSASWAFHALKQKHPALFLATIATVAGCSSVLKYACRKNTPNRSFFIQTNVHRITLLTSCYNAQLLSALSKCYSASCYNDIKPFLQPYSILSYTGSLEYINTDYNQNYAAHHHFFSSRV
ncbi:Uncharacterised protein [Yersinia thracica]|uniref:Uncharacterized protein n=1 Tax=Yersinia thracica TaxID=2890319 RepID=A0A0T9QQE5_9GAMM|nr:Uncharacterised protein [Yersinia thracica]